MFKGALDTMIHILRESKRKHKKRGRVNGGTVVEKRKPSASA